jgi:hypothetical protein
MRRPLALLATALTLALAALPARAGEPLDFDLARLGAPTAAIWIAAGAPPADAPQLAADARVRFGRLATDLAQALSSALLQPASTTGASGFDFDLETSMATVSSGTVGSATYLTSYPASDWPTRSLKPSQLLLPSFHVRKAFPYSLELGGRVIYLSQSTYFATQLEGKWAVVEGYTRWPDVALRAAWTRLAGQRDLHLATTEFDLLASKRFGLSAVISLTPYLGLRYSLVNAGSRSMLFATDSVGTPADPATLAASSGAFPSLSASFYRTTAGVRMMTSTLSLAAELTYLAGASGGSSSTDESKIPKYSVPSSVSAACRLGFEF